jgi:hypothetical protein
MLLLVFTASERAKQLLEAQISLGVAAAQDKRFTMQDSFEKDFISNIKRHYYLEST